ncbi:MAG: hypothetical protein AAGH40_02810 [Verrucomicrobiota bacterium]
MTKDNQSKALSHSFSVYLLNGGRASRESAKKEPSANKRMALEGSGTKAMVKSWKTLSVTL